ncbi:MAG: Mrp/NBP35 family ATP-binding protein [Oscillospiraceae bacterium]
MSESCNHDCANCQADCGERQSESMIASLHEASNVKKVIAVVSGKGGVGKSLVTSLMAVSMQRKGYHTAILDADITGPSVPRAFGLKDKATGDGETLFPVRTKTGIEVMSINLLLENETDPVVWRGPVIAGVIRQFWSDVVWKDIDFMFIDLPPGTGDAPLTVFQSIPVDGIIVVASPQDLVSMIVKKAVNMAGMMNIPILGMVENMSYLVCPDCGRKIHVFGEPTSRSLPVLGCIPIDPKLAAACDAGLIELFDGDWLEAVGTAIEALPMRQV